jgi:phosphoribosylformylglycinamidine synthase PurS subunit
MPTIVVEVMPKAELLDPQGKAVAGALARLGKTGFTGVRIGKRFEVSIDGPVTDAVLAEVRTLADEIFSNSVIEDVVGISVAGAPLSGSSAAEPPATDLSSVAEPTTVAELLEVAARVLTPDAPLSQASGPSSANEPA